VGRPLALLGAGLLATVRRDWRLLIGGAIASVVLLLAVTLPFLVLPTQCSAEQRASLPRVQCTA
jgi:hypothetical protein